MRLSVAQARIDRTIAAALWRPSHVLAPSRRDPPERWIAIRPTSFGCATLLKQDSNPFA
jgi:hypothetical protein